MTAIQPTQNTQALINPGMGWVLNYCDNWIPDFSHDPTDKNRPLGVVPYEAQLDPGDFLEDFPGLSIVHFHLPWSRLEPQEGEFRWDQIDALARPWLERGKKIALRLTAMETVLPHATPQWVQRAGAKGIQYELAPYGAAERMDAQGKFWAPRMDDPIFLEKMDRFLAAAAAVYDDPEHVAFVDIGSFGVWGMGQTETAYPAEVAIGHIQMYQRHFRKVRLMASVNFALRGCEPILYAYEQGLGLRDDSLFSHYFPITMYHALMAHRFSSHAPVLAGTVDYAFATQAEHWNSAWLERTVEEYRASYVTIHHPQPRCFLEAERALIDRINLRLGYRLTVLEANWMSKIIPGETWRIELLLANLGSAPCLEEGHVVIWLKNIGTGEERRILQECWNIQHFRPCEDAETPPRQWVNVTWPLPEDLTEGKYEVMISIGDQKQPCSIALSLAQEDAARRYRLGTTVVEARSAIAGAASGQASS